MYEQTDQFNLRDESQQVPPNVISTSQAINLTSTLASMSTLFALFLCFADQRSKAVRRFSIQSIGLGVIHLGVGMICWILSAILGAIPLVGYVLYIVLLVALAVFTLLVLVLRVRMMLHAYRGIAFVLPVFGQALRKFE